jgi:hypothetical protein
LEWWEDRYFENEKATGNPKTKDEAGYRNEIRNRATANPMVLEGIVAEYLTRQEERTLAEPLFGLPRIQKRAAGLDHG